MSIHRRLQLDTKLAAPPPAHAGAQATPLPLSTGNQLASSALVVPRQSVLPHPSLFKQIHLSLDLKRKSKNWRRL
uniref:Uncharacterized protein n=1 Tax=Arundo donax TaxID=35708 RepID=A0A0A8ZKP2_ARUDO